MSLRRKTTGNKRKRTTKSSSSKPQTEEEIDGLRLNAWHSLADTYKIVYAKVNSDLRRYGLTQPQYSVLRSIGRSKTGSLAMSEIARELHVTYANVTLIVDNLERHNYLERIRETEDRRIVRIELTPRGRALGSKISASHRRKVAELMNGLSTAGLKELINDTSKIKEKILRTSDTKAREEVPVSR